MKVTTTKLLTALSLLTTTCLLPTRTGSAFEVVKNVNSGKPPVEKVVLFEKGKPSGHLHFVDSANCKMSFTQDGSIECKYSGSDAAAPTILWKPGAGIPETFDANSYSIMILTCRLEGNVKETGPNGKVTEKRADNLWFGPQLLDAGDQRVGLANLSDVSEDGKTPSETTVLKIPMSLFTKLWATGKDTHHIKGIVFPWGKTRPNSNRDFRLVIEKIALAD